MTIKMPFLGLADNWKSCFFWGGVVVQIFRGRAYAGLVRSVSHIADVRQTLFSGEGTPLLFPKAGGG